MSKDLSTDPREHPINRDDPSWNMTLYYFRVTDFLPRNVILNAPPKAHKCEDCREVADLLKTFLPDAEGVVFGYWICAKCGGWDPERVDAWEVRIYGEEGEFDTMQDVARRRHNLRLPIEDALDVPTEDPGGPVVIRISQPGKESSPNGSSHAE